MGKSLYSIGQAAKICAVSARTFRYYESKGLIQPDKTSESGYRYYSMETLRIVQVIRYYIEEGFSLEEVGRLLKTNDPEALQEIFRKQIEETEKQIEFYHNRLDSLKAWYALFCEGKRARLTGGEGISIKYIPTNRYLVHSEIFEADDPEREANIETRYFTQSKRDGHRMVDVGGSFTIHFAEYEDRIAGVSAEVSLMQELYPNAKSSTNTTVIDGYTAVSIYHIGRLKNIDETYKRAVEWAKARQLKLVGNAYERYVIDIYSSTNPEDYVTEILLPIEMDNQDIEPLLG